MSDDPTSPIQLFDGPPVDPRFRRRWAEARRAEGRRRLKSPPSPVGGSGGGGRVCWLAVLSGLPRAQRDRCRERPHPQGRGAGRGGHGQHRWERLDGRRGPAQSSSGPGRLALGGTGHLRAAVALDCGYQLEERTPVARIVSGTAEDLVDKSGRVLAVSPSAPGKPGPALPVIMGVQGAPPGAYVSPGGGPQWP